MRIKFDVKDETTSDVYVGQVRKDEFGVYAIVSKWDSEDRPFNVYLITEEEDDLHGAINWSRGTDAEGIRAEFPTIVDAELILKGAK